MKRIFLGLALGVIGVSLASAAGPLSNRRAPGFSLPDASLKQHDLADYRGRIVLVNIMRTTCPHCTTFSKILNTAEKKYAGKLKVLSIVHPQDNQQMVRKYLADNGLSTTILFDCGQMAASYLRLTPQNPSFDVPHFFLVDERGWIQEDHGYSALSRGLFEGDGIYALLDKYVGQLKQAD